MVDKVMVFRDFYYNEVKLSFVKHPFSDMPLHVWVICKYKNKWLLTKHPERGLEFPGGKVEEGESPESAARREVFEETGGTVKELIYIGQYQVVGKSDTVVKNVYAAKIDRLEKKLNYLETEGPVLLESLPVNIKVNKAYSFMMKDHVLDYSLDFIKIHRIM